MCVCVLPARLTRTIVGNWEINHPKYGYQHVLGYQNVPYNLTKEPNCMLLHLPTKNEILPEHILDTSEDAMYILNRMTFSLSFCKRRWFWQRGEGVGLTSASNYIHEMGAYHIAILNNLDEAQETLMQIPEEKRPNIPQSYINFYKEQFPNYPLLICCFRSEDVDEVSPIMVHYTPQNPDEFRLPNIEGHGKLPVLGESFEGDRTFFIGSSFDKTIYGQENINDYRAEREYPHLLPFMPKYGALVNVESTKLKNWDIVVSKKKNENKWRLFFNKLKMRFWYKLRYYILMGGSFDIYWEWDKK